MHLTNPIEEPIHVLVGVSDKLRERKALVHAQGASSARIVGRHSECHIYALGDDFKSSVLGAMGCVNV